MSKEPTFPTSDAGSAAGAHGPDTPEPSGVGADATFPAAETSFQGGFADQARDGAGLIGDDEGGTDVLESEEEVTFETEATRLEAVPDTGLVGIRTLMLSL
ncbi:hypothetical protein NHF46_13795 [Arthrobacter alpinus]|nr:hypothetical protein [Arthrobacter alpinus]